MQIWQQSRCLRKGCRVPTQTQSRDFQIMYDWQSFTLHRYHCPFPLEYDPVAKHNLSRSKLFNYFGCTGSSLLQVFSLKVWREEATLRCGAQASPCGGFSCGRAWTPGVWAPKCSSSSCGTQTQLPGCMWDLPGLGIEPVFPALASGFFPTGPPGMFNAFYFIFI